MNTRVLVVDDDPLLRRAFVDAVRSASDMEALPSAGSVAEGAQLLASSRPDVLLVDLGLPDGSGIALIRQSARDLPACDVMVVTVFGDERNVLASIEAGATGYLLKDAPASQIVDQIRVLRAGGSPINALIARQLLLRFVAPTRADMAPLPADGLPGKSLLSPRECDVLQFCAKGYNFDEIATLMGISKHTVTSFVKRSYKKLQVHSKTAAIYEARILGLLVD